MKTQPPLQIAPRRPVAAAAGERVVGSRHPVPRSSLRPHRPSGFVSGRKNSTAKTVIHNLGHGGSGMSLSGLRTMATDLALPRSDRNGRSDQVSCHVGARAAAPRNSGDDLRHCFLEKRVEHVARRIYAHVGLVDNDRAPISGTRNSGRSSRSPIAGCSCRVAKVRHLVDRQRSGARPTMDRARGRAVAVNPEYPRSAHASSITQSARRAGSVAPVPDALCDRAAGDANRAVDLSRRADERLLLWGGKVVIRKFDTPRGVAAENVIVNCTGLGSKARRHDPELMPLKGQLTVLMPQSEITYAPAAVHDRPRLAPASFT